MTALLDSNCPCQSNKSYEDCCGCFHAHAQFPETAEQLMRSRYAAYVMKNVPYIVDTTVPSQQGLLNVQAIQAWAENTQWLGLQILKTETLSKLQSAVEFNAVFQGEEGEQSHHERSIFVKIDGALVFCGSNGAAADDETTLRVRFG